MWQNSLSTFIKLQCTFILNTVNINSKRGSLNIYIDIGLYDCIVLQYNWNKIFDLLSNNCYRNDLYNNIALKVTSFNQWDRQSELIKLTLNDTVPKFTGGGLNGQYVLGHAKVTINVMLLEIICEYSMDLIWIRLSIVIEKRNCLSM